MLALRLAGYASEAFVGSQSENGMRVVGVVYYITARLNKDEETRW